MWNRYVMLSKDLLADHMGKRPRKLSNQQSELHNSVLHSIAEYHNNSSVAVVDAKVKRMPRPIAAGELLPVGTHHIVAPPNVTVSTEDMGSFAWSTLHYYRGCDPKWLLLWERLIPSGSCGCKAGYKAILSTHPPDFSSSEAFFAWGVALHNAVNEKINSERGESRKLWTVEEARKHWRGSDDEEISDATGSGATVREVHGSDKPQPSEAASEDVQRDFNG